MKIQKLEKTKNHQKLLAMKSFYYNGLHNNMMMGAFQGPPYPSMFPSFFPTTQPITQMDAFKQQMTESTEPTDPKFLSKKRQIQIKTKTQKKALQEEFSQNRYPDSYKKLQLSKKLNLTEAQVSMN